MHPMANKVGGEVETYCGKCKLERTHKIVAVDTDGTILKVVCVTCDSYHKYRAPKPQKIPRTTVRTLKSGKSEPAFTVLSAVEMLSKTARPYAMSSYFQVGEIIEHNSFGRGQVVNIQDDKIEVFFSAGVKRLVHGRK